MLLEEGSRVVGYWDLAIVADIGKGSSAAYGIVMSAGEGLLVVVRVVGVVNEGLLVLVGHIMVIELLEKGAVVVGRGVVVPKLGFDGDGVVVEGVGGVDDVYRVVFDCGMVRKVDIMGRGGTGSRGVGVRGVRVKVKGGHWRLEGGLSDATVLNTMTA